MIWHITNDIKYYINSDKIFENKIVLLLPKNEDEIIKEIKKLNERTWKDFIVLDTSYPPDKLKDLFIVKEVDSDSFLTTQEEYHGVTIDEVLQKKLGLVIRKTKTNFNDMQGFNKVVNILKELDKKVKEHKDFALKPIFLLGMAGTGKSRVAEAYAGEYNIPLIDLNISAIAEDKQPIKKLNEVFNVMSNFKEKVCLRFDEFEQMSKNESLLGEMLTILNDLNKGGYSFNGMMFLTSNNISELVYLMPQFFRHGRFSEKLFISFPKRDNAMAVLHYFNQKFQLFFEEKELEKIYLIIENTYKDDNFTWQEDRSAYVPAELEALMSILKDRVTDETLNKDIIIKTVKEVKPLLVTAKEGVQRMYQKAKEQDFKEI